MRLKIAAMVAGLGLIGLAGCIDPAANRNERYIAGPYRADASGTDQVAPPTPGEQRHG